MHHLLQRQVKKIFEVDNQLSPEQEVLLKTVSRTYEDYDKDYALLERSFDISSKEFVALNQKVSNLLEELKIQKEAVEQKVMERTHELKQKVTELDESNHLLTKRENQLRVANERLQDLDRAKSEFIQIAAHQLRTPITPIGWVLEDLHNIVESEEKKQDIASAISRTKSIINLIDSLLNVSRIETGKFLSDKSLVDVQDELSKLFESFESIARKKKINFTLELSGEETPPISLAPEFMLIAVNNLIQNAINYTPEGGNVTVSIKNDGNVAQIRVWDTGIGIPSDERHKLFSKMYRSKKSIRMQSMGMGIGLYIAYNIVDDHGGELLLEESEEGKGSTFLISLPFVKRD